MQNIGAANADDAFYRYKMPKLVAKIEGRGNGIKTNIVNNVDIAKALDRPPEYVLKYYGCELGAQTNYEAKSGVCIVNGAHDNTKLGEILEGFIKKYVQCYSCGNPETQIKIKKENISLKCKACGFVSDVDPRHKLNTFILKNPPENKMSKEEKRLKKAEEERLGEANEKKKDKEKKEKKEKKDKDKDKEKKEKKEKKKKDKEKEGKEDKGEGKEDEDESEEEADDDDDGVVWMTDTSAEAARKRAEEQLSAATAAMVTVGNIEAEQEEARKKAEREARKKAEAEEAERKRQEEEAVRLAEEAAAKLAVECASNGADSNSPCGALRALIAGGASGAEVAAEVKKLTVGGGLPGKMQVLYEAVLCAPEAKAQKLVDIFKTHKKVFGALAKDQPSQLAQLIALEHTITVSAPERTKETALVLKYLYENDLADDEVILAWAGKEDAAKGLGVPADAAKAVRKVAAPVVEWLQEEEDEDEDEEDDE